MGREGCKSVLAGFGGMSRTLDHFLTSSLHHGGISQRNEVQKSLLQSSPQEFGPQFGPPLLQETRELDLVYSSSVYKIPHHNSIMVCLSPTPTNTAKKHSTCNGSGHDTIQKKLIFVIDLLYSFQKRKSCGSLTNHYKDVVEDPLWQVHVCMLEVPW